MKPHEFVRCERPGVGRLICCQCDKHEAHAIHHARRAWLRMDDLAQLQHREWHRLIERPCEVRGCPEKATA